MSSPALSTRSVNSLLQGRLSPQLLRLGPGMNSNSASAPSGRSEQDSIPLQRPGSGSHVHPPTPRGPEQAARAKPGHSTRLAWGLSTCPPTGPAGGWAGGPQTVLGTHLVRGHGCERRQDARGAGSPGTVVWAGSLVSGEVLPRTRSLRRRARHPYCEAGSKRGELWGEADGRNSAVAGGDQQRRKGHIGQDVCPRRPAARDPDCCRDRVAALPA